MKLSLVDYSSSSSEDNLESNNNHKNIDKITLENSKNYNKNKKRKLGIYENNTIQSIKKKRPPIPNDVLSLYGGI
jgi:hypothetical protein